MSDDPAMMFESTRRFVSALLPGEPLRWTNESDVGTLVLPLRQDADYYFTLAIETGEATISAVRANGAAGEYFWYHPFEDWQYRGGSAELESAVQAEIRTLVTHPTRIIQRKETISWSFTCEYEHDGAWQSVYRHNVLRGNPSVPAIEGSERIYKSPPLRSG